MVVKEAEERGSRPPRPGGGPGGGSTALEGLPQAEAGSPPEAVVQAVLEPVLVAFLPGQKACRQEEEGEPQQADKYSDGPRQTK